jgi:hypothetical protein
MDNTLLSLSLPRAKVSFATAQLASDVIANMLWWWCRYPRWEISYQLSQQMDIFGNLDGRVCQPVLVLAQAEGVAQHVLMVHALDARDVNFARQAGLA